MLFREYNTRDFAAVGRMCIMKDQTEHYNLWVNINRAMNKALILKAASSEMSSVEPPKAVMDVIFLQNKTDIQTNTLTIEDTLGLFQEWTEEQFTSIDDAVFLLELYLTLSMTDPKKGCFLLHGSSNAGKTFWIQALLSGIRHVVGECLKNDEKFRYGNCIGTSVIYADEFTYLNPATVEEFKTLAGGGGLLANR